MLCASMMFATMGACVKLAGGHFNIGQTVFIRGIIPVVLLLAWAIWHHLGLRSSHWRAHLCRSTFGALSMLLYFSAIARLPLAAAVTLNNTSALFMVTAVSLKLRRTPPALVVIAMIAGFIGVALVLRPSIAGDQWLGGICGVAAGFLGCLARLNMRDLSRSGEPAWRTVLFFSLTCCVIAIPFSLLMPGADNVMHATPHQLALLLGLGITGCLGQLALTLAYGRGKTVVTASLGYTTVFFSSLYGVLVWGDQLSPISWLGMGLIIASGITTTLPAVWARYDARHGKTD